MAIRLDTVDTWRNIRVVVANAKLYQYLGARTAKYGNPNLQTNDGICLGDNHEPGGFVIW